MVEAQQFERQIRKIMTLDESRDWEEIFLELRPNYSDVASEIVSQRDWSRLRQRINNAAKFECNRCNLRFPYLKAVEKHLVEAHGLQAPAKPQKTRRNALKCRYCGERKLAGALHRCKNDIWFQCPLCNSLLESQLCLEAHLTGQHGYDKESLESFWSDLKFEEVGMGGRGRTAQNIEKIDAIVAAEESGMIATALAIDRGEEAGDETKIFSTIDSEIVIDATEDQKMPTLIRNKPMRRKAKPMPRRIPSASSHQMMVRMAEMMPLLDRLNENDQDRLQFNMLLDQQMAIIDRYRDARFNFE